VLEVLNHWALLQQGYLTSRLRLEVQVTLERYSTLLFSLVKKHEPKESPTLLTPLFLYNKMSSVNMSSLLTENTRAYSKVSGLAGWSEKCKR